MATKTKTVSKKSKLQLPRLNLPKERKFPFSQRETEVIYLISNDYENKTIADMLGISVETVKEHVQNALRRTKEVGFAKKNNIKSRTGLAVWWIKNERA